MKQPKKGGGTLREYRVLGYRVIVETFSERTAKRWQVTLHNGGDVPRLAKAGKRVSTDTAAGEADSLEPSGGNVLNTPAPTEVTP